MKQLTTVISLCAVLAIGPVQAETLFARLDSSANSEPSYTLGMLSNDGLAAWAIGLPHNPILMAGYSHRFQLNKRTSLMGIVYGARYTQLDQWYVEPASVLLGSYGDLRLKLFGGFYAPLNGGPWRGYVDQGNVTLAVAPGLDLGLGTNARFTAGKKSSFGVGPQVNWRTGDIRLSVRWLNGVNQADSARLELNCPF